VFSTYFFDKLLEKSTLQTKLKSQRGESDVEYFRDGSFVILFWWNIQKALCFSSLLISTRLLNYY